MRGRRDANEGPIVDYLRAAGFTVLRLEDPDHAGLPDTAVLGQMPCPHCSRRFEQVRLIEIKTARGRVRPEQAALLAAHPMAVQLARDVLDAALIVGSAPPQRIERGSRHVAQSDGARQ